jgi:hypothetical protein
VSRFEWPEPQPHVHLRSILDCNLRGPAQSWSRFPVVTERNIRRAAEVFAPKDIERYFIAVDTSASPSRPQCTLGYLPCITKSRGSTGGFWVTCLRRKTTVAELLSAQGFPVEWVPWEGHMSRAQIGGSVGNAMTVSTLEALLRILLPSVGL